MNRKQRDKNRETALALHYACAKWSAQGAWKARLYSPKDPHRAADRMIGDDEIIRDYRREKGK